MKRRYKKVFRRLFKTIVSGGTKLTPEYLKLCGWIYEGGRWREPNVPITCRITITFTDDMYKVWYGESGQEIIRNEVSIEWLQLFVLLVSQDQVRGAEFLKNPLQAR